jgi:hypothetical protein
MPLGCGKALSIEWWYRMGLRCGNEDERGSPSPIFVAKCLKPQNATVAKSDRTNGPVLNGLWLRVGHGMIPGESHGT